MIRALHRAPGAAVLLAAALAWGGDDGITVEGTLRSVQTGDYVHCILEVGGGKTLDLLPAEPLDPSCEDLVGQRVLVRYVEEEREIPEAGGKQKVLSLQSLHPLGAAAAPPKPKVTDRRERSRLLGEHMLTLQWIAFTGKGGTATVEARNGGFYLHGAQRNETSGDFVTVEGWIVEIGPRTFALEGRVATKVSHIADGLLCERTGVFHFRRSGKRKYWRMREMTNPCDEATDYVDLWLKPKPKPKPKKK